MAQHDVVLCTRVVLKSTVRCVCHHTRRAARYTGAVGTSYTILAIWVVVGRIWKRQRGLQQIEPSKANLISADSPSDETLNRGPLALLLRRQYEFR